MSATVTGVSVHVTRDGDTVRITVRDPEGFALTTTTLPAHAAIDVARRLLNAACWITRIDQESP